jgi:two-component system LytT family response regulator
MINAIIIDDEKTARVVLKEMLLEDCKNVNIVAESEDLHEAVKAIRKYKPDLVFLDIEMPGHSGLEILDFFNDDEIDFSIIFTTAYSQYAVQAFKLSAISYLLKPIESTELINAVQLCTKKLAKKNKIDYAVLKENLAIPSKITVPTGSSIKFIELQNIVFLKANSCYTEISFSDNIKLTVSRTLKKFEETLNPNILFFRCHKSYIVNINFISEYVKSEGGYIILKDKNRIPVSNDKINELLEMMAPISR